MVVLCPWCQEAISEGFDLHELLVKRSAVPVEKQDLIMVPENQVPVHPGCHLFHGQKKDFKLRGLWHAARTIGAANIGSWYSKLWLDHGLSVPHGILVPPEKLPLHRAPRLFDLACKLINFYPPEWETPTGDDVRVLALAHWTGRWKPFARKYQWQGAIAGAGIWVGKLDDMVVQGYWMDYLLGVVG